MYSFKKRSLALLLAVLFCLTTLTSILPVASFAEEPEGTTYVLADTLEAGKQYLIASGNSGDVLLLTGEKNGTATNSKQLKAISTIVSADGKITINDSAEANALFTAEVNSNSPQEGFWLKNGDGYLYAASTPGLSMTDSATISSNDNKAKSWH